MTVGTGGRPRSAAGGVAGLLVALSLAAALIAPAGAGAAEKATQCSGANDAVTAANVATAERTLLCEVNVYRVANGLAPLTADPALGRAARGHSEYMERTKQFAHEGIGDGNPSSRAAEAGFNCGGFDCVGENIAYSGFPSTTPTDMFEQWRNSPGHNANMLLDRYVTAGMGFAVGPNYGTTGTQNFAVVDNGATDTAADMLTSGACDTAESAEVSAQARVDKAKRRVQGAKGKKRKRKARKKLRKAKARLKDAAAKADAACDLTY